MKKHFTKKRNIVYFIIIIIIAVFLASKNTQVVNEKIVRAPFVAGTWYPNNQTELSNMVDDFYNNAIRPINADLGAMIVPHAGFVFSGQVAANGFNQINKQYKRVFIIATNHAEGVNVNGISIPDVTHYSTPLGEVKVSDIAKELSKDDLFTNSKESHTTHVIEAELPFLQKKLDEFEIIPMVTGFLDENQINKAADLIEPYLDNETLLVISSDLSHYHEYDKAVELDSACIKAISQMDLAKTSECQACSLFAIKILMKLAKRQNWQPIVLDYKNSGDISGDKSRVVGYTSIIFQKDSILNNKERKILMKLARDTIENFVRNKSVIEPDTNQISAHANLMIKKAAFVSLDKKGALRGSIGHLLPVENLAYSVRNNAINAVSKDTRFNPVEPDELADIEITISVLSIPTLVKVDEPKEYLDILVPEQDGVIIVYGNKQSTYLPQVWEQMPDPVEFLSRLCLKQGSIQNCWTYPNVQIYKYSADVFYEKDILN